MRLGSVAARNSGFANREFLRTADVAAIRYSKIENLEYTWVMLRSQDVLLALRLSLPSEAGPPTFQDLSVELGISASQVHSAFRRAVLCRFVEEESRRALGPNLCEFLVHGIRYVFPPLFTTIVPGVPTAVAAPPLRERFVLGDEPLPVWPHPYGSVRGQGLEPIHPAVPGAALKNPALYELLALVDAGRAGRARERAMAFKELEARLFS